MEINFKIENILGLRTMAWNPRKFKFTSPSKKGFVWRDKFAVAECLKCKPKDIPGKNCRCGIYATFDEHEAKNYTIEAFPTPLTLVEASGRTRVYDEGFRAKEVSIIAVCPWTDDFNEVLSAQQLSSYMRVPLLTKNALLIVHDLWNYWYLGQRDLGKEESDKHNFMPIYNKPVCEWSKEKLDNGVLGLLSTIGYSTFGGA